jgi:speckle-type POZ protein
MATMQPPIKTSSAHRSTFLRGAHQFDIIGYSKLKSLGVRNTVRSVDFEAGGCTWALVCCFDVPAPASNPQQCQLVSISLELVSSDNYNYNSVIAKASLRIDDPTPPSSSGNKRCRRWPPAVWQSAEAHTYPATNYGGDDSDARSWKLSVPDAFREPLYVKDDRLTIHCTVVVLLQEDAETTSAARSCSVSVVPPPAISRDLRRLLHLDGSKSNSSGMPFATDVTFIVEQTEIHAHRLVLAMRSPVFNAGLLGAMKESAACSRVTIDDMSASTFKAMLFFIYTDELPNSHKYENQNVGDLLVAADRYDLERLRLMCEKILAENMDAESAMPTLMLVHMDERGAGC